MGITGFQGSKAGRLRKQQDAPVTLDEANQIALAMVVVTALFWVVNLALRLAGHRLYQFTSWVLVIGLPALAIYFLGNPSRRESVNNVADFPREYALAVVALFLWLVVLALELSVFVALKVRNSRRAHKAPRYPSKGAEH